MNVTNITIDKYFNFDSTINGGWVKFDLLSKLSPTTKKLSKDEVINRLRQYPLASLTVGTVTIGNKKILKKDYYEQYYLLTKALKEYGKKKKMQYIAFIEDTKIGIPHAHLLIYNGYQNHFSETFDHLGQHNRNKKSFQPLKHKEEYIKYIQKEQTEASPYFTNVLPKDKH